MQSLMASNALAGARGAYAAPNSRAKLNRRVAMSTRRPAAGAVTVRAGKTPDGPRVAIAGISGAVGTEFMRVRIFSSRPMEIAPFYAPRARVAIGRERETIDNRFFFFSRFFFCSSTRTPVPRS